VLETYTIIGVMVVAVVVLVLFLKARTDRFLREGGGRVTMESQSPNTSSSTSTSNIAVPASADPSTQADAIESALGGLPDTARATAELAFNALKASRGLNMSLKTNIKTTVRVQSKELADAIAQRERARGMNVTVIEPTGAAGPDGKVDNLWTVTASKGTG
jgi:hypothetical protein